MVIVHEKKGVHMSVHPASGGMPPEYRVVKERDYYGSSYAQVTLLKYENAIAVIINGEDTFHSTEFFREFCVLRNTAQIAKCNIRLPSSPNTDNSHAQAVYDKEHSAFLKKQISLKGIEALERGTEIYKSIMCKLNKGVDLLISQKTVFEGIGDILDNAHKKYGIE